MVGSNWVEHGRFILSLLPPYVDHNLFIAWVLYYVERSPRLSELLANEPQAIVDYFVKEVFTERD